MVHVHKTWDMHDKVSWLVSGAGVACITSHLTDPQQPLMPTIPTRLVIELDDCCDCQARSSGSRHWSVRMSTQVFIYLADHTSQEWSDNCVPQEGSLINMSWVSDTHHWSFMDGCLIDLTLWYHQALHPHKYWLCRLCSSICLYMLCSYYSWTLVWWTSYFDTIKSYTHTSTASIGYVLTIHGQVLPLHVLTIHGEVLSLYYYRLFSYYSWTAVWWTSHFDTIKSFTHTSGTCTASIGYICLHYSWTSIACIGYFHTIHGQVLPV